MPRFVILEHSPGPAGPRELHWDLMLEFGGVLRTWALNAAPSIGMAIDADELPDHRPAYLEYEGPVSGGRGDVARWDAGEFQLLSESPTLLRAYLTGSRFRGQVRLVRADPQHQRWRCEFSDD